MRRDDSRDACRIAFFGLTRMQRGAASEAKRLTFCNYNHGHNEEVAAAFIHDCQRSGHTRRTASWSNAQRQRLQSQQSLERAGGFRAGRPCPRRGLACASSLLSWVPFRTSSQLPVRSGRFAASAVCPSLASDICSRRSTARPALFADRCVHDMPAVESRTTHSSFTEQKNSKKWK